MAVQLRAPRIPRPPLDPATEAFCTKCKNVKPHNAFAKNKNTPTGLHKWCKTCNNTHITEWEKLHYRERRDSQAIWSRRKRGSDNTSPVYAKQHVHPHLRGVAS